MSTRPPPNLPRRVLRAESFRNLAEIELQNNRPLEAPSSEATKIPVIKSASERKSRATTDTRQVGRPRGRPKSSAAEIASPMNSAPTPPGSSSAGRLDEATAIPPSRPFALPASTAARSSASATPARVTRPAKPSETVEKSSHAGFAGGFATRDRSGRTLGANALGRRAAAGPSTAQDSRPLCIRRRPQTRRALEAAAAKKRVEIAKKRRFRAQPTVC